jgi:hypothetical protein
MATTATRSINLGFSSAEEDGLNWQQIFSAASATTSPAVNTIQALTTGNNTITVPTGSKAVTIIPPSTNTQSITLKGVDADTGIALSLIDPSSISLSGVSSFVLNVGGAVTVRLIFS